MLTTFFHWLDLNPGVYWWLAGLATLLLVVHVGSVVFGAGRGAADFRRDRWCDALVLILFLLAWRWPFLLAASKDLRGKPRGIAEKTDFNELCQSS